jgi:hypothetical protein
LVVCGPLLPVGEVIPTPRAGEVLIKIEAFGLNRSELHTRLGLADGVTFLTASTPRSNSWAPRHCGWRRHRADPSHLPP